MKVTTLERLMPMSLYDIIRFQVTTHCFNKKIRISPAQLDTLAYLGLWGEMNISDFCNEIVAQEIFGNSQTVRNFILKSVREEYVDRGGKGNKMINLSNSFDILTDGNMVITMKVYHVEDNEG